jgi:hypothetical protein
MGWVDDAAGFNGGSSLSVLSSIYAKSVRRVQNAILQAISDAINLFLLNRGLKTYLNNFTLRMKTPLTQDELDYRSNVAERISAISSAQALFTDIEGKSRRLEILKTLIGQLNYGDVIIEAIQKEIEATEAGDRAQRKLSLKIMDKDGDIWQIHQPALLPKIKHGDTQDSVVIDGIAHMNDDVVVNGNLYRPYTVKSTNDRGELEETVKSGKVPVISMVNDNNKYQMQFFNINTD